MNGAEMVWAGLQAGYRTPVTPVLDVRWQTHGIHVLIGRNGAGKSTLLRTVAGLQRPTAGTCSIAGQNVHAAAPVDRARLVSFLPGVPPRGVGLTVGAILQLVPGTDADRHAVLARVGAEAWWSTPLERLSDGQIQRTMLARVLLQNAAWTVLDEPTAFLDAPGRTALFAALAAGHTGSVLLSTHDFHLLGEVGGIASVHALSPGGWQALDVAGGPRVWEAACR